MVSFLAIRVLLVLFTVAATYVPLHNDSTNTLQGSLSSATLRAELSQVNSTSTNLTIFNDAMQDVSLLKWNSLFDYYGRVPFLFSPCPPWRRSPGGKK